MQGVNPEGQSHKRAPMRKAGAPAEPQEEQHRIRHVKEQVHHVRRGGIDTEKGAIQLVRNPGERMPVAGMRTAERPRDILQCEPSGHVWILGHVIGVVVARKAIFENRRKREKHH